MTVSRVLMMVGNDIRFDTRVLKSALALADAGVQVTVLGYSAAGRREESELGAVRILRVPVPWRMRDRARTREVERRRRRVFRSGTDAREQRLASLRAGLRAREATEQGGLRRRLVARGAEWKQEAQQRRRNLASRMGKREERWRERTQEWSETATLAARWRVVLPEIDDYELAFGPVVDELEWDVIHAHDVHMVGVASRACARRRAAGRPAAWVYDAHEFVAGLSVYPPRTPRRIAAYVDLEKEYIGDADRVLTVTAPLAEELHRRYRLRRRPDVVMNSPVLGAARPVEVDIRAACGVAPGVPLLVYSGGLTSARGVDTVVEALVRTPGTHLAVVVVPHRDTHPARALAAKAEKLGVADRVHLLDPVRPEEVSAFVASADVGLIPILHFGSHEFALANKLFEYLHAGLPVLVSDCRAQREFVEEHGVGRVHAAGDPDSFAAELGTLLKEFHTVRERIVSDGDLLVPYAWERQEARLRGLYRELLGEGVGEPAHSTLLSDVAERPVQRLDRPSVVGIGPANMAGQAWAWAKAIERELPGLRTHVMVVDRDLPLVFPADEVVPAVRYRRDAAWSQRVEVTALKDWTHALLESGRPLFGVRHGTDFEGDVAVLRSVGIGVGLLLHGSEARNPARHARTTPWSPFTDPGEELTTRLQRQWEELWPKIARFIEQEHGPVFVSTPDLLEDVPGAHWLPVVVDPAAWATDAPVLEREVPVVLHAPSRASLKGSAHVDAALAGLVDENLVEYRYVEGVAPEGMPEIIAGADIVLDQFALGSYGVMAVQAMAAGRVVIGHVTDAVRAHVRGATGADLPLLEAAPDTLADTLGRIVAARVPARAAAAAGIGFAREVHDGGRSARVLAEHMRLRGQADHG